MSIFNYIFEINIYAALKNKIPETALAIIAIWVIIKVVLSFLKPKARGVCVWSLLVIWLMLVLHITIFSRDIGERSTELGFGHSYFEWLVEGSDEAGRVLIMNIIMFIPGGLLLSEIFYMLRYSKIVIPIAILSCFSFVIEILQFSFALGLAETDDVINNTLGAAVGCLITGVLNKYDICKFK